MSTNSIVMKTRDHEQYKCFLPETSQDQDKVCINICKKYSLFAY